MSERILIHILTIFLFASKTLATKGLQPLIEASTYDVDFVRSFTRQLHEQHNFDGFVTFSNDRFNGRSNVIALQKFERNLVETFHLPIIIWRTSREGKFRRSIGLNNLAFIHFKGIDDPLLDIVDKTLEALHFMPMHFFYRARHHLPPTAQQIEQFFDWCWQRNMVNVALTFQIDEKKTIADGQTYHAYKTQVYNYSPFPKLTVYNLTAAVGRRNCSFLTDTIKDVKGYVFKLPVFTITPHVFVGKDFKNCEQLGKCGHRVLGTVGLIGKHYFDYINGRIQYRIYPSNTSLTQYMDEVSMAPAKRLSHIGLQPIVRIDSSFRTEVSYPVAQTCICIILPVSSQMNWGYYFLQPFGTPLWILLLTTLAALIVLEYSLAIYYDRKSQHRVLLLGYGIMLATGMFFNQSLAYKHRYQHTANYRLVHSAIIVMTLILGNVYMATMASFLSTITAPADINTAAEFLDSGLKILTTKWEQQMYFNKNVLPHELMSTLRITDIQTENRYRYNFDTRFAYVMSTEKWLIMAHQQNQLRRPLFRRPAAESRLCSAGTFVSLGLQWDSPFKRSLDIFVMSVLEAGLVDKWLRHSMLELRQLGLIGLLRDKDEAWRPMTAHDFRFAADFFIFVKMFCITCFCMEFFWFNFVSKNNKVLAVARLLRCRIARCIVDNTRKLTKIILSIKSRIVKKFKK